MEMSSPAAAVFPRRKWPGRLLCAVLGALVGAGLGAFVLVLVPVAHVKAVPAFEEEEHQVYFIAGSNDPEKARSVWKKARLFLRGGSVQVSEDELNVAAASARVESPEPDVFTLGAPNFRLFSGQVHVAVPVTVTALGLEREVLVQMSGAMVPGKKEFTLAPSEVYVGSCALHSLPGVGEWLVARLWSSSEVPRRVRTAWRGLRDVRIDGVILKLEAKP